MFFSLFTILPFTVCLFWVMVFALDWRRDNGAQHVLTAFMTVSAALYLCHAVFFNHETDLAPISEIIYSFCNLAVFPLYYLYICRLTSRGGITWRQLCSLLPAVGVLLWTVILGIFCPTDAEAEALRQVVMRSVFMLQLIPICWLGYRRLRKFDKEIANHYADVERRSVRPTSRMMGILLAGALLSGIANFIGRDYFDSSELSISIPSVLFTLLLFGVGYVGKRQDFCIDDLLNDEKLEAERLDAEVMGEPASLTDDSTGLSEQGKKPMATEAELEEQSQLITRLDAMMAERRLYLKADLRLSEIATMLGIGRTTLSQRINKELRLSFSDYINNLRVAHACQLLNDPASARVSLAAIAEMSGFSSESSFYRAFKSRMGMTPKQYTQRR